MLGSATGRNLHRRGHVGAQLAEVNCLYVRSDFVPWLCGHSVGFRNADGYGLLIRRRLHGEVLQQKPVGFSFSSDVLHQQSYFEHVSKESEGRDFETNGRPVGRILAFGCFELNNQLLAIHLAIACQAQPKIYAVVMLRPITCPTGWQVLAQKRFRLVLQFVGSWTLWESGCHWMVESRGGRDV